MPVKFTPLTRRLARRRFRLTSRRGGIVLALVAALAIGGGFLYWRGEVQEALDANAPDQALIEECVDLAEEGEAGGTEMAQDPDMAMLMQRCEALGLGGEEE